MLWQRGKWSVAPFEPLFSKTQPLCSLNTSPDVYLLMRFQGYIQTDFLLVNHCFHGEVGIGVSHAVVSDDITSD